MYRYLIRKNPENTAVSYNVPFAGHQLCGVCLGFGGGD